MKKSLISAAIAVTIATVPSAASAQVCPVSFGLAICPPDEEKGSDAVRVVGVAGLALIAYFLLDDSGSGSSALRTINFSAQDGISKKLSPNLRVNFLGVKDRKFLNSGPDYSRRRLEYNPTYSVEVVGARYSF